jgi:hypothetical protein
VPKANRKKLDNKAKEGVFVGYSCTTSLYWILVDERVAEYWDVSFNESPTKDLMSSLEIEEEEVSFP